MADANVWENLEPVFTNRVVASSVYKRNFAGKVLVFPTHKGGIFSTDILIDLATVGNVPVAMINMRAHPVIVTIALLLNIPLVDRLDKNPVEVIETGDWVKVDAEKGIVEVIKKPR